MSEVLGGKIEGELVSRGLRSGKGEGQTRDAGGGSSPVMVGWSSRTGENNGGVRDGLFAVMVDMKKICS